MAAERSSIGLILLLYGAGLGAAAQLGKIASSFPMLREAYPANDVVQGLLLSLVSLMGVVLGVVAGQLVASQGYKRMLVAGLALGGAMSLLQALLPPLPVFMASRLIEGLSHLAIVVAAPTLINLVTAERHRYLSMTLWSSFFGVAFAVLAFVAPVVLPITGLGGFYGWHGAYMLLFAALIAMVLPASGVSRSALPGLKDALMRHVSAYSSPRESPAALGWLCYTLTYVSILTVLPPYLPADQRVMIATILPLASILSSFVIGAGLMRFLTAVTVTQIGFIAAACAAAWLMVSGISPAPLVAIFLALGLVQSASFAVIPELNTTAEGQALATGAVAQTGNLGNALGTPLLLALVGALGVTALPVALIALYLLGIAAHEVTKWRRAAQG